MGSTKILVSRHWHCPVHENTMGYGNENRGELGSSSRSTPTKLNEYCGILGQEPMNRSMQLHYISVMAFL